MTYFGTALRFALAVIVLMLIGYINPGHDQLPFGEAVLVAFVIGALGYGIQIFLSPAISGYVRGFVGFIVAGVVIEVGQYVVPHLHISPLAALIVAVMIGLFNGAIPNAIA